MSKVIIFQDGKMIGYLDDENAARSAVYDRAEYLVNVLKKSTDNKARIVRENIDNGINIYSQNLVSWLQFLDLKHTITWVFIPKYKPLESYNGSTNTGTDTGTTGVEDVE